MQRLHCLSLSERQAFSCLNLSCIMWPMKQSKSKRKQNIEQSSQRPEKNFLCNVVVPFLTVFIFFSFFFWKFPIEYFNYFRLLRVLHRCFCLISVFIFSPDFLLHLPFSLALFLSLYPYTHSPLPCHRWTSVLQFICYGIEFHLAVFFYISDEAQRGVCATYLPCVIDNEGQKKNIWN